MKHSKLTKAIAFAEALAIVTTSLAGCSDANVKDKSSAAYGESTVDKPGETESDSSVHIGDSDSANSAETTSADNSEPAPVEIDNSGTDVPDNTQTSEPVNVPETPTDPVTSTKPAVSSSSATTPAASNKPTTSSSTASKPATPTQSAKPATTSTPVESSSKPVTSTVPTTPSSSSSISKPVTPTPTVTHTHKYTASVTKNATCDETGIKTYKCSCGDSYTETIPATGHSYKTQTIYGSKQVPKTETWYLVNSYNVYNVSDLRLMNAWDLRIEDYYPEYGPEPHTSYKGLTQATADKGRAYILTRQYWTNEPSLSPCDSGERIFWPTELVISNLEDKFLDARGIDHRMKAGYLGSWTFADEAIKSEVREVPGEYVTMPDNKTVKICTKCGHTEDIQAKKPLPVRAGIFFTKRVDISVKI